MESKGYKLLYLSDFGQIKEAMFDTRKDLTLYFELIEFPGESVEGLVEKTLPKMTG